MAFSTVIPCDTARNLVSVLETRVGFNYRKPDKVIRLNVLDVTVYIYIFYETFKITVNTSNNSNYKNNK